MGNADGIRSEVVENGIRYVERLRTTYKAEALKEEDMFFFLELGKAYYGKPSYVDGALSIPRMAMARELRLASISTAEMQMIADRSGCHFMVDDETNGDADSLLLDLIKAGLQ